MSFLARNRIVTKRVRLSRDAIDTKRNRTFLEFYFNGSQRGEKRMKYVTFRPLSRSIIPTVNTSDRMMFNGEGNSKSADDITSA